MPARLRRSIKWADFGSLGPITASELVKMSEESWRTLRQQATDSRNGKDTVVGVCPLCSGQVYIPVRSCGGIKYPLFQHFAGADPTCPWYSGKNREPNEVRIDQYHGRQESLYHRNMCMLIDKLISTDPRCLENRVNKALEPRRHLANPRRPDVYARFDGLGEIAFEFQLSSTFQTEISQRCIFYEKEQIGLIWVLAKFDCPDRNKENIRDIIFRHRGNALVLDIAARDASITENKLFLSCYLENGCGFDEPTLVSLDDLTFPQRGLPFTRDRAIEPSFHKFEVEREKWRGLLRNWDGYSSILGLDRNAVLLIGAALSIIDDKVRVSKNRNIKGLLNGYLYEGQHGHTRILSPYAHLLKEFIRNSWKSKLLETKVGNLITNASARQQGIDSAGGRALRDLFPEIMDQEVRNHFSFFDALPSWSKQS